MSRLTKTDLSGLNQELVNIIEREKISCDHFPIEVRERISFVIGEINELSFALQALADCFDDSGLFDLDDAQKKVDGELSVERDFFASVATIKNNMACFEEYCNASNKTVLSDFAKKILGMVAQLKLKDNRGYLERINFGVIETVYEKVMRLRNNYSKTTQYELDDFILLTAKQIKELVETKKYDAPFLSKIFVKLCMNIVDNWHQDDWKEVLSFLIQCGVNVNYQDNVGNTGLMWSIANMNLEVAEYLIDNFKGISFDIGSRVFSGNTALHLALSKGFSYVDPESPSSLNCGLIAKKLVEHGAKLDLKNDRSVTPLDIAFLKRDLEFLQTYKNKLDLESCAELQEIPYDDAKYIVKMMFPAHGVFPGKEAWEAVTMKHPIFTNNESDKMSGNSTNFFNSSGAASATADRDNQVKNNGNPFKS